MVSKKQSKVETSIFGVEFVAIKQGIDVLRGTRFMLRLMCIPCQILHIFMGISQLHMILPSLNQCLRRRTIQFVIMQSRNQSLWTHIPGSKNVTNPMTKVTFGQRHKYLVGNILYDIHDDH